MWYIWLQDKECMLRVMKQVDKANGYVFGQVEERDIQSLLSCAVGAEFEYEKIQHIQEKHMGGDESATSQRTHMETSASVDGVEEGTAADFITWPFREGVQGGGGRWMGRDISGAC